MAYRIDDDENRIQDIKDQIDSLEVQTFSPEVVARNESTRNTGIETGDGAATNPYPEWYPVRDFGDVGLVTQEIVLNRVDSQIAKMTIVGDVDFAFSEPPPANKGMWFILDVTIDAIGGYTINLPVNIIPSGTVIDNTANSRTVLRFTTTDGGVTFFAENISVAGGAVGDNLGDHIATETLKMNDNGIFLDSLQQQSIIALALANNYIVPVGGAHDFFVNDTVTPKFGITETSVESNVNLDMNTNNIFNMGGETINALTEDLTPVGAADFVMTFDASAGVLKKVLLDNLPGGGGASPLTTKGDLFGFDTADARIPVGVDTQVLTANSAVSLGVEWAAATVLLSNVTIDVDKSWNDKNITDLLSVGSSAAIVPGSGFIRMGTGEEIRMKNPGADDDIIITSGLDALSNDALIFGTEGTTVFTMSLLNTDFKDTNLIGTGDVLPRGQVHTVGDSVDFYAEMHSDIFITESSSVNPSLYGLAKIGNTLFINYDDTNVDAGFGIFEQGIRHFLFSNPSALVHELFIGPDPFNAGEEYRIQLGENSTSSGRIFFIEGTGNDVIIDRAGGGVDQGVQVRVAGLSAQRWLSGETRFFKPLNIDSQDITNVRDVFADTFGNATIGEFQPSNGGFDYILRDRMSWESDPDTFIEMSSSGLSLISDDAIIIASTEATTMSSVDQMNIFITASTGLNISVASSVRVTIQDNALVLATGTDLFVQNNFASFSEIATPATPGGNTGLIYVRDEGTVTTPFFLDSAGTETSLIASGGTSFIGFEADANLDMNAFDILDVDDITFFGSTSLLNLNGGDISGVDDITMGGIGSLIDMNSGTIVDAIAYEFNQTNMFISATSTFLAINATGSNQDMKFFVDSGYEMSIDGEVMYQAAGSFTDFGTENDGLDVTLEANGFTVFQLGPLVDTFMDLGDSDHRWGEVFAVEGTINTSFSKFKKEIEVVAPNDCLEVCEAMDVIKFKWDREKLQKFSDDPVRRTLQEKSMERRSPREERVNFGYKADVLSTMCPEAVKDDGIYERSVIGLLLGAVKELSAKVKTLEST